MSVENSINSIEQESRQPNNLVWLNDNKRTEVKVLWKLRDYFMQFLRFRMGIADRRDETYVRGDIIWPLRTKSHVPIDKGFFKKRASLIAGYALASTLLSQMYISDDDHLPSTGWSAHLPRIKPKK